MDKQEQRGLKICARLNDRRKFWCVFEFAMLILLSCCLFPLNIFNLDFSRDLLKYVVFIAAFVPLGALLAYLRLSKGNILKNYGYVLAAVGVGLGARYLLEYGEIANANNFTAANVYLFILGIAVFAGGGYLSFRKTIIKATNVKKG